MPPIPSTPGAPAPRSILASHAAPAAWLRFSLAEQLALYGMFHRDPRNRRVHALAMPFILWSGFALGALVPMSAALPIPDPWRGLLPANLGLAVYGAAALCFASLDVVAALILCAWVLPLLVAADQIAARAPASIVLPGALAVQIAGWYLSVIVGHERLEPRVEEAGRLVSTNVYLEKRMFRLRNVGRRAGPVDAFVQFAIAPYHLTFEALFRLGYRPALRRRVKALEAAGLRRMARGGRLFDASRS
jgi:uncharacterized membrane protein YGL010W